MEKQVKQYRQTHNELLERWKAKHKAAGYRPFVSDGIVCPERWFSQDVRVLFILKEAYHSDPNAGDWSLTDSLNDRDWCKGRIWTALAEWQQAVHRTTAQSIAAFDNWLGSPVGDMERYREARHDRLKACAVINIKKSNGKNPSADEDLEPYVAADWALIKEQIEVIDPTVIVCGSTFHLLKDRESHTQPRHIFGESTSGIAQDRGCFLLGGRPVIAYYHPANQYPSLLNHYGIAGIYHDFLRDRV